MLCLEIGGTSFRLETAAVSAVRYRSAYGESIINHLAQCTAVRELEGRLLRMCHAMVSGADAPALLDFAALARRDKDFLTKACQARAALLAPDPRRAPPEEADGEPFDEYQVLALLAAAGLGTDLIYELPVLHLVSVIEEALRLKGNGGETAYHAMTAEEMRTLYPR